MGKKLLLLLFICIEASFVYGMESAPKTLYEHFGLDSRFGHSAIIDVRKVLAKQLMQGKQWWYTKQTVCDEDSAAHLVAYSSDGAVLATASKDNKVRLWDQEDTSRVTTQEYPCAISDMVCVPNKPFFIVALPEQNECVMVDFKGIPVKTFKHANTQRPKIMAVDADGVHVCTYSHLDLLTLWPLSEDKHVTFPQAILRVEKIAYHPGIKRFIAVGATCETTLDFGSGTSATTILGHVASTIRSIAVEPKGEVHALGADNKILLCKKNVGERSNVISTVLCNSFYPKNPKRGHLVKLLSFDRTGTIIAAAYHESHTYLNAAKGECVHFGVPDRITLWNVQDGREIANLLQEGFIQSFVFHPCKNQLSVACENKPVRIWQRHEIPTFEQILLRLILKEYLAKCILECKNPLCPDVKQQSSDESFIAWMEDTFNVRPLISVWLTFPAFMRLSIIRTYVHRVKTIIDLQQKNSVGQVKRLIALKEAQIARTRTGRKKL